MKFATLRIEPGGRQDSRAAVSAGAGWWVQFGPDLLVYSADGKWAGATAPFGRIAPEGDIRKGAMHLVVQKGRTFQLEHPDARVILDRGRYLVVDMPRETARRLAGRRDPCFRIEPLRENSVVFEEFAPARRQAPDPAAVALVATLSQPGFEADMAHLVSFPTRLSTSDHYRAAADWACAELAALDYAARTEPVAVGQMESRNVRATKPGRGADRQELIVVAHLDSVNHPDGPAAPAPGADDNASGSAGLLALARACARHDFEHDLTFLLFGGEEQGLHGSTQYVAALDAAARARIRGVLNMDMIGAVNAQPPAVLLEGAALSQEMIDALAEAAAAFTGLTVQTSLNPFASDHVPFIDAGIPAVLTIEGADGANDAIHTANDTLDRVDPDFAMDILRMNLGYLAAEAGIQATLAPGAQPKPADCGCGGSGAHADNATGMPLRELSAHYQMLFAQYARLQRSGVLLPQDYANWQNARLAHDQLRGGG